MGWFHSPDRGYLPMLVWCQEDVYPLRVRHVWRQHNKGYRQREEIVLDGGIKKARNHGNGGRDIPRERPTSTCSKHETLPLLAPPVVHV